LCFDALLSTYYSGLVQNPGTAWQLLHSSPACNPLPTTLGKPDEVDDSAALYEFVRQTAATSSEVIETFDIQTPCLMFDYGLGDIVSTSPESRDLLACRSDNRSTSRIVKVQMDFEKQCTNLKIVRQRS
jgi:hypothetical protein